MTDAPETITKIHWRYHPEDMDCIGDAMENVQYTRTDHSQALIAAAYEAAAGAVIVPVGPRIASTLGLQSREKIFSLTPADAQAALDKLIADAERRGMERAAELETALSDLCQSVVWQEYGECRGFSDSLKPLPDALLQAHVAMEDKT